VKYLIDTNVISELRKGKRAHPALGAWWAGVDIVNVYLSVLVLGEVRQGIEKLHLEDPGRAQQLEGWLESMTAAFGVRVLTVNQDIADRWGRMGVRRTLPLVDSLLAATAMCHEMTLVTRNTRDIQDTGVRYLNPFETSG
jgi:predicted nucleic acid-binding protein